MLKTNAVQFRGIENWVKEILSAQLIEKDQSVCELYSRGSDIGKWQRCGCAHYYVVEPNEDFKNEAVKKWTEKKKPFKSAKFLCLNPCTSDFTRPIKDAVSDSMDKIFPFGGMACFGSNIERSFSSEESAKTFFSNCASITKPGGYFFGYMLDSSVAWTRAQKLLSQMSEQAQSQQSKITVKGELYQLVLDRNFENYTLSVDGEKDFQSGVLIKFPVLSRIAKEYGFDVISLANWHEFFEDFKNVYWEQLEGYQVKGVVSAKEMELVGLMAIFILQRKNK
ncbi:mRNA (guanine-N7-)-methyltransferase [Acrasis kona]|uniref:mRNA (guanine-N(7))-methyltransferase n=1 Tax=Acrasis kona TaxID=1008807 RepID=A0AAW2Z4S9_9EUKA